MNKLPTRKVLSLLVALYAAGPIIAAALDFPDRRGPRVYPEIYHELLFSLTYAFLNQGEKSRIPFGYDRPWFYGTERPIKERSRN